MSLGTGGRHSCQPISITDLLLHTHPRQPNSGGRLAPPLHEINFSRVNRNRGRRGGENTLSSLQETAVMLGNIFDCATAFQVLSPVIKEEKFLSWLQSEPPILLWIPTCYRLSATEMATHPVRCRICKNFPITGLRYSHSPLLHRPSLSKWIWSWSFLSPDSCGCPSHTFRTQLIWGGGGNNNFLYE